jgi:multidrug efflux pump subunit AcrB
VLLAGTVIWGLYGYTHMPQRKDPDIPIKAAMVVTAWPGASSDKVEELVTKPIEKVIASNNKISKNRIDFAEQLVNHHLLYLRRTEGYQHRSR